MAYRHLCVQSLCALGLVVVFGSSHAAGQQPGDPPGAKRAGVKRIGVATAGTSDESVRQELIALLQGEGSLIEVVPLTNRIEAFRLAEAKKRECDFILDTSFEAKPKSEGGGLLARATRATGVINKESGSFANPESRREDVDRKTASVDNIAKELAPAPQDKVRVVYRLFPTGAAKPVLADEKELAAADLNAYLEEFLNDVVTLVLK